MDVVEAEIAGQDWSSLRCGCGASARHLADDLLRLARAERTDDVECDVLGGHVMRPSVLLEPALPVVSVALAALADQTAPSVRFTFLEMLLLIVAGEGQAAELALQGRDLVEECRMAARSGIWLLYSEVFSGRSVGSASYAYEILTLIDEDEDRVSRFRVAAGERLSEDLR